MLRKKIGVLILLFILISSSAGQSRAKNVDLRYKSIDKKLKYKNMLLMNSLLNTGEINVNTNMGLTSFFDTQITKKDDQLLLKLTFSEITLDMYKRELEILDKNAQKVNLKEKKEVEKELKNKALYKWINLLIADKGQLEEKYYSPDLDKINNIDLTDTAEQLIIEFPEDEIQIGHQWKEYYKSTIPPYDKGQPFDGVIKYTYLGNKEHNGILSYKIQASLFMEEERKLGKNGITRVSRMGSGTLYYAVEGNYLVESTVSSDLTLLSVTEEDDGKKYRNFIRTRIDHNITLIID